MKEENLRLRDHEQEELSFYSKATTDIEFLFPFGWGELWGIADRTDYDLEPAQRALRQVHGVLRSGDQRALYPLCRRAVAGRGPRGAGLPVRRLRRGGGRTEKDDTRVVLRLHPALAPYQGGGAAAVQEAERQGAARSTPRSPSSSWWITTTPAPSASATAARTRSARRSASPTTLTRESDGCVTVRDRDTMQQDRRSHRQPGFLPRGAHRLLIAFPARALHCRAPGFSD